MQSIELKEFQIEAVNKLLDATSVGKKKEVLVQAPTGSGKTIILLSYIEEYLKENRKTIFVLLIPLVKLFERDFVLNFIWRKF